MSTMSPNAPASQTPSTTWSSRSDRSRSSPSSTRYPGTRSFDDTTVDRLVFRARGEETEDLLHLVMANRLVVVYGASGSGKTSLLQAGLFPALRGHRFFPVAVRVTDHESSLIAVVAERLSTQAPQFGFEYLPGDEASLLHFFKTMEMWVNADPATVVLVLDQFEDLFRKFDAQQRVGIVRALGALVRGSAEHMKLVTPSGDPLELSTSPPNLHLVLSLEERDLGRLEVFGDEIPTVYQHLYRVTPLSRHQAEAALREPARLPRRIDGVEFCSEPFEFADDAVAGILDFLETQRERTDEAATICIDPLLLQIVCRFVEAGFVDGRLSSPIDLPKLGGASGLRSALERFYRDRIAEVESLFPAARGKLSRLFEEGLIDRGLEGRRRLREEAECETDFGIGREVLTALVERRLLRSESRFGLQYYEISHAALIDFIRIDRDRHRAEAARGEEERVRQKRRNRVGLGVLVAGAVICTIAAVGVHRQRRELALQVQADKQRVEAKAARVKELRARWQEELRNGEWTRALTYIDFGLDSAEPSELAMLRGYLDLVRSAFARNVPRYAVNVDGLPTGDRVSALSGDGRHLAVASREGVVRADIGAIAGETEPAAELPREIAAKPVESAADDGKPTAIALSPDGTRLVVGYDTGRLRIWGSSGSGSLLKSTYSRAVRGIRFSRGGRYFVSIGADGPAVGWTADGHRETTIPHPERQDFVTADIDDRGEIVTGGTDSLVRSRSFGKLRLPRQVGQVALAPGSKRLFTGCIDPSAFLWDLPSSTRRSPNDPDQPPPTRKLRGNGAQTTTAGFSADGTLLVTTSRQGLRIWNTDNGTLVRLLGGSDDPPLAAAFEGRDAVVSFHHSGVVRRWQTLPPLERALRVDDFQTTYSAAFARSADQEREAYVITTHGWKDDGFKVWDISTDQAGRSVMVKAGRLSRLARSVSSGSQWLVGTPRAGLLFPALPADWGRVSAWAASVRFSAPEDGTIAPKLWVDADDLSTGQQRFLTLTPGGVLTLHDAAGRQISFPAVRNERITAASFARDGSMLVASRGPTPVVYDARSLRELYALEGHAADVVAASFHPTDSSWLVTASVDGTARVWHLGRVPEVQAGARMTATLQGHLGPLTSAVFDPARDRLEDLRVLTSSLDGTIRLWSVQDPAFSVSYEVEEDDGLTVGEVRTAAFDTCGERIVTAGQKGGARVWTAPSLPELSTEELRLLLSACLPWRVNDSTLALERREVDLWNCMQLARNAGL